jgi:hypothetical protein
VFVTVVRFVGRALSSAWRGMGSAWHESQAAQNSLLVINTPWQHDGELRWRRGVRGWQLHGSTLATIPVVHDRD